MFGRKARLGVALGAVLVTAGFAAGGWVTITVEDLPDSMAAGEAVELAFTIRQHGAEPMSDASPSIVARQGSAKERVAAKRQGAAGRYVAAVTLPRAGEWSLTIDSDYNENRVTLLPMLATGPGTHAPPALSMHERGRRLFVAKGCFTCHVHAEVEGSGNVGIGPDLTQPRFDAKYMARILDDPSILPVRGTFRMPDLALKPHEIEAIVAFLEGEAGK